MPHRADQFCARVPTQLENGPFTKNQETEFPQREIGEILERWKIRLQYARDHPGEPIPDELRAYSQIRVVPELWMHTNAMHVDS